MSKRAEAQNPKSCTNKEQADNFSSHLTWQEKLSITPICICMHLIFHMFAVDVLDILLPSCLTGGLWVSATAYHLWNGWYCNNRTAKMESSSVQSPQSFPLNVFKNGIIPQWAIFVTFVTAKSGSVIPYSTTVVNKDLGHCFKYCQLEVPLLEIWPI